MKYVFQLTDSAMMSLMLLTFLSGVVTTATFTLMMQFTQNVSAGMRATHYTSLATVEVIGKLLFTSSCGWLATIAGYRLVFLLFIILSAVVLQWIRKCPQELGSFVDAVAEDTSSSSLNENDL
jgi:MFS family permease